MSQKMLKIDPRDNVAVALADLTPGEVQLNGHTIPVKQPIPQKHKILLQDVKKGDKIIMYGVPVGVAKEDLVKGSLTTIENIVHFANEFSKKQEVSAWSPPDISRWKDTTFMGYHRKDGSVGTANYWLFIPLVFCENRNLRVIEDALLRSLGYKKEYQYEAFAKQLIHASTSQSSQQPSDRHFKNIDGIKFLYHQGGCGGTRDDSEMLLRLLTGYVNNPNVAGATVLSLGCQNAQISWFQSIMKETYPDCDKPIVFLEQQQLKNEDKLIRTAIESTIRELEKVNETGRKPAPLSKIRLGLECGGSDGFSGISANPAVGYASDLIVALGGSTILSEFPELNGVEQNLVDRCVDNQVAQKFMTLQKEYDARAHAVGSGFHANPSPGNIKDGLITDAIKSAGAAKKGGTSPVVDVLDYAEPVTKPGLNLLCTPGNDVESTTGLAGSGASIILFTTGLGTPTGNPIAPTLKISSNTRLYESMNDIIDVNAGEVISGEKTIEQVGADLLEKIIETASGAPTKAMLIEQDDFIPWKRGISL